MTLDQITVGMERLINVKASEILSSKPQDQQYLNWRDMQEVCLVVKSLASSNSMRFPKAWKWPAILRKLCWLRIKKPSSN